MVERSKSYYLAKAIRPQMMLLPFLIFLTVVLPSKADDFVTLILGLVLLLASYGLVTLYNDLSDVEIDRTNERQDIPLAAGHLTQLEVGRYMAVLAGLGAVSAIVLSVNVLLWFAAYILFGWLYSGPLRFKSKPFLSLVVLGICYGLMPWLLGALVTSGHMDGKFWLLAICSLIFSIGLLPLKDFKDEKGDRKHDKRTLLVVFGSTFVHRFMLSLTSLAYITLIISLISWLPIAAMIVAICAIINTILLFDRHMLKWAASRVWRGNYSRGLFFATVIVLFLLLS